jgi:hypothetical protein
MTNEIVAEYIAEGKKISNDIKAMFEKQAADAQVIQLVITLLPLIFIRSRGAKSISKVWLLNG